MKRKQKKTFYLNILFSYLLLSYKHLLYFYFPAQWLHYHKAIQNYVGFVQMFVTIIKGCRSVELCPKRAL